MQQSAFVASNPFCVGVLYLGSYNKYVSLLKTYSICLIWSRVWSGLLALHCPDSDMYHKSISGRSPRYQQHCVFLSLGPGAQDYVWTSILDYPCGLWETLIIENDSTWSEGQKKRIGFDWALWLAVLSHFMTFTTECIAIYRHYTRTQLFWLQIYRKNLWQFKQCKRTKLSYL